jgi:hypothetical protein
VLLPGEKFFVRRIQLTPGQNAALQVELALETFGPFSPGQIFHGFCASRDGTQALLFAAYRKNFTAEEIASWATADVVLPEFALWLAQATPPAAGSWLYEDDDGLQLIAWDGGELPAGLFFRKTDYTASEIAAGELLDEASKRLGVPTGSPRRLGGNFVIEKWSKEGLSLKLDKPGQTMTALLPVAMARSMDVRDKAELASLSQQQKRTLWLWRAFVGIAAGMILCVVAEIGLQVAGKFLDRQQEALKANAGNVQKIEQANTLAARMEKMAGQRFKLIGMLAALNDARPKTNSLIFTRLTINSATQIEVEAQTNNASDPAEYEKALRKSPEIAKFELRKQELRNGMTTFQFLVEFKPGFPVEEEIGK